MIVGSSYVDTLVNCNQPQVVIEERQDRQRYFPSFRGEEYCYIEEAPSVVGLRDLRMGNIGTAYSVYKPRTGSLARVLLEKQRADQYLNNFDKNKWYQCNISKMPQELQEKFVQLETDNDTLVFLEQSEDKSDWIFTQIWHSLAKAVLSWFMTQTSINGWLQRGSMFVVSLQQFMHLLTGSEVSTIEAPLPWTADSLLDLGAGDGEVTARLARAFKNIYVTEMSPTMQTLLRRRGFQLLDIDKWAIGRKYDMISCLNLLDRCDKPIELLEEMRSALNPGGLVLLALVLPFSPYVETGSPDYKPQQLMPIRGRGFEEQIVSFVTEVAIPAGFEVVRWSRVPYLCEGDLRQSYYWLDDSIFVLRVRS